MMEQDLNALGHNISEIYQHLEQLEVLIANIEVFWAGEAKEVFSKVALQDWDDLVAKRRCLERSCAQLEKICELYGEEERRILEAIESLRM
jgi:uncharacterized protein YukE